MWFYYSENNDKLWVDAFNDPKSKCDKWRKCKRIPCFLKNTKDECIDVKSHMTKFDIVNDKYCVNMDSDDGKLKSTDCSDEYLTACKAPIQSPCSSVFVCPVPYDGGSTCDAKLAFPAAVTTWSFSIQFATAITSLTFDDAESPSGQACQSTATCDFQSKSYNGAQDAGTILTLGSTLAFSGAASNLPEATSVKLDGVEQCNIPCKYIKIKTTLQSIKTGTLVTQTFAINSSPRTVRM